MNNRFTPRPDGKKTEEGTKEKYSMLIDGSGSRGVGANIFDEDTFFTLWLHLINLQLPGAGICGDDQGIADKKKAKNTGKGEAEK